MADYNIPDLLDRIRTLEKRVLQLEVSARAGLGGLVSDFSQAGSTLTTSSGSVWSNFTTEVSVEVETGNRALVMMSAQPVFDRNTAAWGKFDIGWDVLHVESGRYIAPDDMAGSDTQRVMIAYTEATYILEYWETAVQIGVETDLTPGLNKFTMMGRYTEALAGPLKPGAFARGLTVIPLDR
jgi:hypothetical protein